MQISVFFLLDDDDGKVLPQNEKVLSRKEMGLDWMLKSERVFDNRPVKSDIEHEKPQDEEVGIFS